MAERIDGPHSNGNGAVPLPGLTENAILRMERMVENLEVSRSRFFESFLNLGNRDLDRDCGYPTTTNVGPEFYRELYDREAIPNRVVQLMPRECWQSSPQVYEEEEGDEQTPFEQAWDDLGRQLAPNGKSWHQDEEGSPVWEYLSRIDVLSGIGQFGVLLLGIDDGKNLQDPVDGVEVVVNGRWVPDSNAGQGERELWEKDEQQGRLTQNQGARDLELSDRKAQYWARKYEEAVQYRQATLNKISGGSSSILGGAPPAGAFIQGTDQQHSGGFGLGMAMPAGASLSGTDQQYFGVQFGPSQRFADTPPKDGRKLLFMRCFDESLVQVVRYEWNIRNPRFGLPVMYRITLNDPRQPHSGVGLPLATVYVHWSRVIHIADNLHSSEIFGVPRMRPVLNRLLDLRKLYASSAEGYWKSCFTAYSLETHPQLGGDVLVDKAELDETMAKFFEGLQRNLTTTGMTVKTLAPAVVDPTPHVAVHIEAICIQIGCPVRVFKGSERGELASGQDDEAWNERKRERQHNYLTPKVICPLVDRLIQLGVLPMPKKKAAKLPTPPETEGRMTPSPADQPPPVKSFPDAKPEPKPPSGAAGGGAAFPPKGPAGSGLQTPPPAAAGLPPVAGAKPLKNSRWLVVNQGQPQLRRYRRGATLILNAAGKPVGTVTDGGYSVEWPDLDALGDKDKAGICLQNTQALATYISGNCESVLHPHDFLTSTSFMGMDDEQAAAILGAAVEAHAEQDAIHQDMADEHDLKPQPPPGFEKTPPPPPPGLGMPGGPPVPPVKVGAGQALVHPQTGQTVAQGPPVPKPPGK